MFLIGNVVAEPETRTTQSGVAQCTFRIAVQRRFTNSKGEHEADFLNIVAWRKTAEFCGKYVTKGSKVAIDGSIQTRSYDAKDGSKRWVTDIIADNVEFFNKREDAKKNINDDFVEVPDEKLPWEV